MEGKEQFVKLLETMKFVTKDNEWYLLIYFDAESNTCRYKKVGNTKKATEENTMSYEDACGLYNIEIIENPPLPDQYFFTKIKEPNNNTKRTVSDKTLINYLKLHNGECIEVIDKLKEIVQTHEDYPTRKAAYTTLEKLQIDGYETLKKYTIKGKTKTTIKKERKKSNKSKLYNPPVGEFGFCCEEERMAIVFNHIKDIKNFDVFQREFTTRYPYEASLVSQSDMERLYKKYYEYATNGKLAEIQHQRRNRINSTLSQDIINILKKYGLRVTRADGRGTSKPLKKCRRKTQYDADRLSGYRIISIKRGIPIAGKKYELYEDDVKDFTEKLISGEIVLDEALAKERL